MRQSGVQFRPGAKAALHLWRLRREDDATNDELCRRTEGNRTGHIIILQREF